VTVKVYGQVFDMTELGHRVADGVLRYSTGKTAIQTVLDSYSNKRDATPLAQTAPTSLVFGAWDSRKDEDKSGVGAKIPRMFWSEIRATDVFEVPRYGQYSTALSKEFRDGIELDLAGVGLQDIPVRGLGGVIVRGDIFRYSSINVRLVRKLYALLPDGSADDEGTQRLRRYILGLSLYALTVPLDLNLRQGCNLFPVPEAPAVYTTIDEEGVESVISLTHAEVTAFAESAAKEFGIGKNASFEFAAKMRAVKSKKGKKAEGSVETTEVAVVEEV
jgi:CRISPR-associated protein Csb1